MFRVALLILFVLFNLFACLSLVRTVRIWIDSPKRRRLILRCILIAAIVLNAPLVLFFYRPFSQALIDIPPWSLRLFFYPATAWLAAIMFFFLIAGPPTLLLTLWQAVASLYERLFRPARKGSKGETVKEGKIALSRREFLTGSAGLLIPGIYAVAAYNVYGNIDELEVSAEQAVAIPYLPQSLEGMTIVQLSDLHVGPYIRARELQHLVSRTNDLRPDLVVITGDILDWHLGSIPDVIQGLSGLRASLGMFAVLGNHDISSDRYSYSEDLQGGINVARGLAAAGIRTLRNEVVHVGFRQNKLALLGLDWLSSSPTSRNFYGYQQLLTREQLQRLAEKAGPETPRVLLCHHPDTFVDAQPHQIGLTLAGHTHGGGQIVLGSVAGVPMGIGAFRFKYLSGLYQEQGCSLYVNRGFGYLGVPIRINCPPEISRFKLVRKV